MSPPSTSSSGSDRDDDLEEDMLALRRACMLTGTAPGALGGDTGSDSDSSDTDDIDLLRHLQERFSLPSSSISASAAIQPQATAPFSSCPIRDSDEEDDLETLQAIRRRFAQYESDAIKRKSETSIEETQMVVASVTSGRESPAGSSKSGSCMVLREKSPDSDLNELMEDEMCSMDVKSFTNFSRSAHSIADALKKNRALQKFIRWKLIEIQSKMETNKGLRERLKCLMDFQANCKRKVSRFLNQDKDPRLRLISTRKSPAAKNLETGLKKLRAFCFGPEENSHVAKYKMVMERFPTSFHKLPWSDTEKEKLVKGIKQQYQEMLVMNSMNFESEDSSFVLALSSADLEIAPEKIRSFLPLVNWDRLASMYLPGRSGAECESRWLNCEDPLISHNPWTPLEEKKLLYIVQERGVYNWIEIATMLGTQRTPFQCLARYQRSLNPHILNKDWTEEEDAKLRAAVETFGEGNWQIIATNLEGRSGVQCSNRWRKSLHPDRRKVGRWSVDEDKHLKVAVTFFGAKNWNKIARFAPGRTQVQCRERWLNCLDPSLNLEPWTKEEDAKLLAAIELHGHSWSKVATCVPPRTDSQCRRRWKVLRPQEVPLLRESKMLKRNFLVSNFVDRESERPLIVSSDFLPLLPSPAAVDLNDQTAGKRKRRARKTGAKRKSCVDKNPTEDGTINPSSEILPGDLSQIPSVSSTISKSRSTKRSRMKTSRKSGANCQRPDDETPTQDAEDGTFGSLSEISPSKLSVIPSINFTVTEGGRMKRIRKKPSRYDQDADDGKFGSSSEISPSKLSVIPSINSTVAEGGRMKRIRKKTSRYNIPDVENPTQAAEDGTFGGSSEISPSKLSLIPSINSTVTKGGRMKRIRKKTSSDSVSKKGAHNRPISKPVVLEENLPVDGMVNPSSRNFPADSSLSAGASYSAIGSGNMKKARRRTSRNNLPQRSACENSIDEVGANSSNDITPADLSIIPFEDYSALSVIPSVNSFPAGNN